MILLLVIETSVSKCFYFCQYNERLKIEKLMQKQVIFLENERSFNASRTIARYIDCNLANSKEGFFNRISGNEIRTGSRSDHSRERLLFLFSRSCRHVRSLLDILCSFNPAVIGDIDRTRLENCSY